jgi:two-component system chemotaxis response regulator CheB
MTDNLRVVIADDSALFRAVIKRSLISIGGVDVIGQASNGSEALDLVRIHSPDLLTLDLNMPVLDGLQTLKLLREERLRCDVVVVSTETTQGATTTLEALQLGAVDFITKPDEGSAASSSDVLSQQLRRQLAGIRLRRDHERMRNRSVSASVQPKEPSLKIPIFDVARNVRTSKPAVVAIGSSTGGPAALPVLLGGLPCDFPVPIIVVQHMPPLFTAGLADALTRKCKIRVFEAKDGQLLQSGSAYVAPGGKQLNARRTTDGRVQVNVTDDPPENHCKPSVDYLFRSLAQAFPNQVIAAILTGMGNDGVAGLRLLKAAGAATIAQDEATCTVFGMPQEAIRAGVIDNVLPLNLIASNLLDITHANER